MNFKSLVSRIIPSAALLVSFSTGCAADQRPASELPSDPFLARRAEMVRHLRGRGISDAEVIAAMMSVPRHEFVPARFRELSYQIRPLPIGLDQTISSPYIVAYMTEAADISPDEKVLEIGTGSGYQAAVLAEMTDSVYSIEILPELADVARMRLPTLGYGSVNVRTGNGYLGWPDEAPFDAIVVTAAPDEVPKALENQLAINGRMIIPVGAEGTIQQMLVITRTSEGIVRRHTLDVRFVPMTGKPSP